MGRSRVIAFLVFFLFCTSSSYAAPPISSDIDAALNAAESLFQTMKEKDYRRIWALLTQKSKEVIVSDVIKAETNRGNPDLTKQNVTVDFSDGGPLSRSYWNAFLDNFDPDAVLTQSKWDVGKFQKNRGEIVIRYRKSEGPALLQMYKEQGLWKVGLVETFWSRKPAG